jgi:hypothetical protein
MELLVTPVLLAMRRDTKKLLGSNKTCFRYKYVESFDLTFIVMIALTICENLDVEKGTPKCVRQRIRDFNKQV